MKNEMDHYKYITKLLRSALLVGVFCYCHPALYGQVQLVRLAGERLAVYPENLRLVSNLQQRISTIPTELLGSVFLARPLKDGEVCNTFSGTVIETVYNGQKEIYGVIASHAIVDHVGDPSLEKIFTADIYVDGKFFSVPAEIVQLSSIHTLDLALVKFPQGIEHLLRPLELSDESLPIKGRLQLLGFNKTFPNYLSDRSLLSHNSLYLRASMDLSPDQRRGLCGAPVLDEEGKLVAFHTGTVAGSDGEPYYVGFATQAKFGQTLVDAYHNEGKAKVPFELNWLKIVDLDINESVSYVELLDDKGEVLWERPVRSKFPYREVEGMIRELKPRYIDLVTSVMGWEGDILALRTKNKFGSVNYHYDLKSQTLQVLTKE